LKRGGGAMTRMCSLERWRAPHGLVLPTLLVWLAAAGSTLMAQQSQVAPARDMDVLKTRGGLAALPSVTWVQKRDVPIDVHFATPHDLLRSDAPYDHGFIRTRETPAGERGAAFKPGDAILTGTEKESWPIARAVFESTYAPSPGGHMGRDGRFSKKPMPVLAAQINEPFAVTAAWGRLQGKPGDWLVQYDEDGRDFGIVGQAIFEQTYDRIAATAELRAKLDALRGRVRYD
jgi:hypothetical protein